jgi:hypothetical protein
MKQFLYCVRSLETPVTPSVAGFLRDTIWNLTARNSVASWDCRTIGLP